MEKMRQVTAVGNQEHPIRRFAVCVTVTLSVIVIFASVLGVESSDQPQVSSIPPYQAPSSKQWTRMGDYFPVAGGCTKVPALSADGHVFAC